MSALTVLYHLIFALGLWQSIGVASLAAPYGSCALSGIKHHLSGVQIRYDYTTKFSFSRSVVTTHSFLEAAFSLTSAGFGSATH